MSSEGAAPVSGLSVVPAPLPTLFVRSLLLPSLERDPDDPLWRFLPLDSPSPPPAVLPDLVVSLLSPEELLLRRLPDLSDPEPLERDGSSASDLDAELVLLLAEDLALLADVSGLDVRSERLVPPELEPFLPVDEPALSSVRFSVFSALL